VVRIADVLVILQIFGAHFDVNRVKLSLMATSLLWKRVPLGHARIPGCVQINNIEKNVQSQ
jgi:hypothetical protein